MVAKRPTRHAWWRYRSGRARMVGSSRHGSVPVPVIRHSDWRYIQSFGYPERDALRLVNWNVNRAAPWSKHSRGVEIVRRIDRLSPEIVCLTETHPELLGDGHTISAGIRESPRKVLLWSREPWKHEDHVGDARMPPGRFVSGVTRTSVGEVTVVGVCIPWDESRTPRYGGVRGRWDDHEDYLERLAGVLSRAPSERLVVMGDFNQKFDRPRPGSAAALRAALLRQAIPKHVKVVTLAHEHRGLDHIALSDDLVANSLDEISNIHGERELSDPGRCGLVADVFLRGF